VSGDNDDDEEELVGEMRVEMRLFGRSEGSEVLGELVVGLGEVREAAVEGLLAMSVAVGLKVMAEMMEEELTRRVGPKHAKLAGRRATRHASAPGSVVRWPEDKDASPTGEESRWY
jgi:hypothetical protein